MNDKLEIEKRYRIEPGEFEKATIYLVGCGGTGSFAALHLARLAYASAVPVRLVFVDPDVVEEKNIGRQNFVPAEIGLPKAVALARRYSYGFGLEIEARVARLGELGPSEVLKPYRGVVVMAGCVDSVEARVEIRRRCEPGYWWVDAGNDEHSGQVLIGNGPRGPMIDATGFCTVVPWPSVQEPGLVGPPSIPPARGEVAEADGERSCAELLVTEAQSLMINQAMAGWLATYVYRLLLCRDLDVMATYVNLAEGTVRSVGVVGEVEGIWKRLKRWRTDAEAWTDDELLEIADGTCPECGGGVAEGRDTYEDAEVAIIFCPGCEWQFRIVELEGLLEQPAIL